MPMLIEHAGVAEDFEPFGCRLMLRLGYVFFCNRLWVNFPSPLGREEVLSALRNGEKVATFHATRMGLFDLEASHASARSTEQA